MKELMVFLASIGLALGAPAFAALIISSLGLPISFWQAFGACVAIQLLNNTSAPLSNSTRTIYIMDGDKLVEVKDV